MLVPQFRVAALCMISILLCISFVLGLLGTVCPVELIANTVGNPIVITRESDLLCTGISQVVADNHHIYVLFGNYSVVQVYTLGGDYEYSVAVHNHLNGMTSIAAWDNSLYICDKIDNIYVISEGKAVEFIDRTQSLPIWKKLRFGASSYEYDVRFASVWKTDDTGVRECVIQRPAWLTIYQGNFLFSLQFLLAISAGFILTFLPKYKSNI